MTTGSPRTWLKRSLRLATALALASGTAQAAVCIRPGVPVGCTVGPDAGLRPAAGPGVGPNYGGPVNVNPVASPGAGPNAGRPVNRAGWR
ncbi:MAG: hypothetical protein RLZZ516_1670 [Cyanobacteriota bacterium]|jgi:hypothetical protein|nr:hypothetical protein [Synechococcaceae bacterium WB4_1_0192]